MGKWQRQTRGNVARISARTVTVAQARGNERGIWALLDNQRYMFHHALLREVAYEMQLTARRRELHHRAADALIATAVAIAATVPADRSGSQKEGATT